MIMYGADISQAFPMKWFN